MSQIYKCDICRRTANEGADIEHYKMKKEVYSWHEKWWSKLDICRDCLQKIRDSVKKGGVE